MMTSADQSGTPALTCDLARAEVFAAIDGELDAATLGALNAHLADCAPCGNRLKSDVVFLRVVRRAVSPGIAPASLRARVALLLHERAIQIAPA